MSFYDDSSNTIITVYSKADGPTEQGAASHVLIGYSSGQYCPFWSRAEKKSVERTYKARNLWTMSVTESQKKKKNGQDIQRIRLLQIRNPTQFYFWKIYMESLVIEINERNID